jgi:hypothetical protein
MSDEAKKTYKVERLYQDQLERKLIKTGLTLEEAKAHCQDPETSSSTCTNNTEPPERGSWFDSYDVEGEPEKGSTELAQRLESLSDKGMLSIDKSSFAKSTAAKPPSAEFKMPERAKANLGAIWSDHELTRIGVAGWEQTYKLGYSDERAISVAASMAEAWSGDAAANGVLIDDSRKHIFQSIAAFAAKWAVHAFQRIVTTHTYAAALMCSDADREALEDIEIQWKAFMVLVPNGLLAYRDEEHQTECEYNRILVATFDERAVLILVNQSGGFSGNRLIVQLGHNLADLLEVKEVGLVGTISSDGMEPVTKQRVQRVVMMAKRLVTGLLLSLQHQDNFKSKNVPARTGKPGRDNAEPAHRVVMIGKPLNIDCRPAARDFIANGSPKRKNAPPAVQSVVRGHHKRQVIGVGRKLRKVIWVQPYWKGPEGAPILTRPKKVGS